MARQAVPTWRKPSDGPNDGSEFGPGEADPVEPLSAQRRGKMRDRFVFPADCATGPRRGYIVKHLLAPGDVGALIGAPGTGKSILAPHLAYALAQGRPAFGLRTKPGRFCISQPAHLRMRQRIYALMLRYATRWTISRWLTWETCATPPLRRSCAPRSPSGSRRLSC